MIARFDRAALAELKRRVDLVDLIGREVELKKRGREWVGLSPFNQEKTPSFTVVPRKRFWHCFSSGKNGDAVGWLMQVRGFRFMEAVRELAALHGVPLEDLGLDERPVNSRRQGAAAIACARYRRTRAEAEGRSAAFKLEQAAKIWRSASLAEGTAVEAYLRSRGIAAPAPASLRFVELPHASTGDRSWPVMVAVMQDGAGRFAGVHRTWLDPSGEGKAPVTPGRMMLGRARGAVVRLCPPAEHLHLAEGIETALSVMQSCGVPCWAVMSRGNFRHFDPPDPCGRVTNLADNDTRDWRAARRIMRHAAHAQAERGLTVETAWPPRGDGLQRSLGEDGMSEDDVRGAVDGSNVVAMPRAKFTEDYIHGLNERYALVVLGSQACVLRENGLDAPPWDRIQFLAVSAFRDIMRKDQFRLGDRLRPGGDLWLEHPLRRDYDGIEFVPGADARPRYYNLWSGYTVEPSPKGDCTLFLAHIEENAARGSIEVYDWIVSWFASIVQRPLARYGTSLVLRGRQGTGKTFIGAEIGKLFGPHYVLLDSPHLLVGQFNAHMKQSLLVQADEGFWAGDKQAEGRLKSLVTAETHMVEGKGRQRRDDAQLHPADGDLERRLGGAGRRQRETLRRFRHGRRPYPGPCLFRGDRRAAGERERLCAASLGAAELAAGRCAVAPDPEDRGALGAEAALHGFGRRVVVSPAEAWRDSPRQGLGGLDRDRPAARLLSELLRAERAQAAVQRGASDAAAEAVSARPHGKARLARLCRGGRGPGGATARLCVPGADAGERDLRRGIRLSDSVGGGVRVTVRVASRKRRYWRRATTA